jgi:hypothetical protein
VNGGRIRTKAFVVNSSSTNGRMNKNASQNLTRYPLKKNDDNTVASLLVDGIEIWGGLCCSVAV